jgi:Na+/H+ antiporter NhaD/arsenite permease-like protein
VDESLELGAQLALWAIVPFALMLLSVAILPLAAESWFGRNRNKAIVAAVLGVPTIIYLVSVFGRLGLDRVGSTAEEYVSFLILLFALFTISGGIYLTGNLVATPRTNLSFLAVGALLASFIGTMGASMVLIRPLLRANSERKYSRHTIVFFIFAVSNGGGLLTPLGDPPLFLGFLRGVPFGWTLGLWPQWLLVNVLVLVAYAALEYRNYRKEPETAKRMDLADYVPMRLKGGLNVILLGLVIVTVALSGQLTTLNERLSFPFVREVVLVVLSLISLRFGPRGPRASNHFTWGPIAEVAILFAGIFATMIPALALLEAKGASIGVTHPWQYFWATGGLSSFLDNAPTYLVFTSLAQGQVGAATVGGLTSTQMVPGLGMAPAQLLAAISCGAVFMGAMTYVGNAPNFAVKAVAEHSGLRMPSFFGYMGYSVAVLVPTFLIVTAVFFL